MIASERNPDALESWVFLTFLHQRYSGPNVVEILTLKLSNAEVYLLAKG